MQGLPTTGFHKDASCCTYLEQVKIMCRTMIIQRDYNVLYVLSYVIIPHKRNNKTVILYNYQFNWVISKFDGTNYDRNKCYNWIWFIMLPATITHACQRVLA